MCFKGCWLKWQTIHAISSGLKLPKEERDSPYSLATFNVHCAAYGAIFQATAQCKVQTIWICTYFDHPHGHAPLLSKSQNQFFFFFFEASQNKYCVERVDSV